MFSEGGGRYWMVRGVGECAAPRGGSVVTRVAMTVKPGAPREATQPDPSGNVTVFGDVGDVRGPVVEATSTVLVPQIRTVMFDDVAIVSIITPVFAGLRNCRSIAPSKMVASRASGYREM